MDVNIGGLIVASISVAITILIYKYCSSGQSSSQESAKKENKQEIKEEYFKSVEDEGIKEGNTVKVTSNAERLDETWIEAELGINDDKSMYLGCIGKIMEIEEDDDTVQLRWANYDTCWIPIKACIV